MNTKTMRQTTQEEKEIFIYLNHLRESGIVNMYGARPYIEFKFGTSTKEAGRLLRLWMTNFDEDGNYDEIIDKDE